MRHCPAPAKPPTAAAGTRGFHFSGLNGPMFGKPAAGQQGNLTQINPRATKLNDESTEGGSQTGALAAAGRRNVGFDAASALATEYGLLDEAEDSDGA